MLSHDEEEYLKKLLYKLATEKNEEKNGPKAEPKRKCEPKEPSEPPNEGTGSKSLCSNLSPSQLLVTAGLLTGVLDIDSVVFNRDQTIDIVVTGSLKRQTPLDRVIEQIGKLPFEDVVRSILDNQNGS